MCLAEVWTRIFNTFVSSTKLVVTIVRPHWVGISLQIPMWNFRYAKCGISRLHGVNTTESRELLCRNQTRTWYYNYPVLCHNAKGKEGCVCSQKTLSILSTSTLPGWKSVVLVEVLWKEHQRPPVNGIWDTCFVLRTFILHPNHVELSVRTIIWIRRECYEIGNDFSSPAKRYKQLRCHAVINNFDQEAIRRRLYQLYDVKENVMFKKLLVTDCIVTNEFWKIIQR